MARCNFILAMPLHSFHTTLATNAWKKTSPSTSRQKCIQCTTQFYHCGLIEIFTTVT